VEESGYEKNLPPASIDQLDVVRVYIAWQVSVCSVQPAGDLMKKLGVVYNGFSGSVFWYADN